MSTSFLLKSTIATQTLRISSARLFSSSSTQTNRIENVLILGSGLMGTGIAQCCATSGKFNSIVLQDISIEKSDLARKRILASLNKLKEKNKITKDPEEVLSKIKITSDVVPECEDNLLVIEAIPEKMEPKLAIFRGLSAQFKDNPTVLLATNTSVLPCFEIKKAVEAKDRFAALHFFNPVPQMKLVEIARTQETSDRTVELLKQFVQDIDHTGVICLDNAGFIVNRLLGPYLREAQKMLDSGSATVKDIDTAMKLGAGYPLGPFEVLDYIGLDTHLLVGEAYRKYNPEMEIYRSKQVESLVNRGHLGRKTGKGFYEYNSDGSIKRN